MSLTAITGVHDFQKLLRSFLICHTFSFDEFSLQNLPSEGLVVYVCSTTGQGEEPDNMKVDQLTCTKVIVK